MSDDFDEKMISGMTHGGLRWGEDKVKEFAKGIFNKKYSFIETEKNVDIVKSVKKLPEYKLFSDFIDDSEYRPLFLCGIALRKLEKDKDGLHKLKDNIYSKYGSDGVHIAEMVQNGIFSIYLRNLLNLGMGKADIKKSIKELIKGIRHICHFIFKDDIVEKIYERLKYKILGYPLNSLKIGLKIEIYLK